MKTSIIIALLIVSNFTLSQDLTSKIKRNIRKELKGMLHDDQSLRVQISQANNVSSKDSLWVLQNNIDSVNLEKLLKIIEQNGYPSYDRIGTEISVPLILHLTKQSDFKKLHHIFLTELKKGNMPKLEYARWYDRTQLINGKTTFYGVYGKTTFCGEELLRINNNRNSININSIPPSQDCP